MRLCPCAYATLTTSVCVCSEIIASALNFACTKDGKLLVSCGHWDNSFKASWSEGTKQAQHISVHRDIVTCVELADDGSVLVTGSKDTTTMVWRVNPRSWRIEEEPLHILSGHNDEVTCVAVHRELDVVVSGSKVCT